MKEGKKSTAEKIFYGAMEQIEKKTGDEPLKVFKKALSNVKPAVEVKSRRIGGATYQIPVEVRPVRRQSLALRWLRDYSSSRSGKTMIEKLSDEILDASANRGGAVKKREDVYKMAEANKAFAYGLAKGVNSITIYNSSAAFLRIASCFSLDISSPRIF